LRLTPKLGKRGRFAKVSYRRLMKTFFIIIAIQIVVLMTFNSTSFCDSVETIVEQFGEKYEALTPPTNSSVNTDYKQQQIALGSFYSVKMMEQIYNQNKEMVQKNDQLLKKYDEIVQQNRQVIQLLSILVEKETNNNRLLTILVNGKLKKGEGND
jgi:anion-transporting  ArsA/GET3 family ATPase